MESFQGLEVHHPEINFNNIFTISFLYENVLCSFSLITVWLFNLLAKVYWRKAAHKMLAKMTPVIHFTNILHLHGRP